MLLRKAVPSSRGAGRCADLPGRAFKSSNQNDTKRSPDLEPLHPFDTPRCSLSQFTFQAQREPLGRQAGRISPREEFARIAAIPPLEAPTTGRPLAAIKESLNAEITEVARRARRRAPHRALRTRRGFRAGAEQQPNGGFCYTARRFEMASSTLGLHATDYRQWRLRSRWWRASGLRSRPPSSSGVPGRRLRASGLSPRPGPSRCAR
jgi:hypothetical protein